LVKPGKNPYCEDCRIRREQANPKDLEKHDQEGFELACEGWGQKPATYMFVGISAGRLGALLTKVPFTKDASGRLFQRCLHLLGLNGSSDELCETPPLRNCYVTNLVKGRCLGRDGLNRLPTEEEVAYWWPHFQWELKLVQPYKLLSLGTFVKEHLQQRGVDSIYLRHPRWYQAHGGLNPLKPAFTEMLLDYRKGLGWQMPAVVKPA
jgi:uracil-DNA glycosylase family 4